MTETPPAARHEGAIGALTDLGSRMVSVLPPAFVMLCVINAIFIAAVLWFLDDQVAARTKLVQTLVEKCMDIALHAQPPH